MSSGQPHHLAQHCQATPSFPGNISSSPRCPQERKREQLCTLKDIRAESKGSSKLPPRSGTGTAFPRTALVHQTPLTAHSGMGFWSLLAVFPKRKCSWRGARRRTRLLLPGEGLSLWLRAMKVPPVPTATTHPLPSVVPLALRTTRSCPQGWFLPLQHCSQPTAPSHQLPVVISLLLLVLTVTFMLLMLCAVHVAAGLHPTS